MSQIQHHLSYLHPRSCSLLYYYHQHGILLRSGLPRFLVHLQKPVQMRPAGSPHHTVQNEYHMHEPFSQFSFPLMQPPRPFSLSSHLILPVQQLILHLPANHSYQQPLLLHSPHRSYTLSRLVLAWQKRSLLLLLSLLAQSPSLLLSPSLLSLLLFLSYFRPLQFFSLLLLSLSFSLSSSPPKILTVPKHPDFPFVYLLLNQRPHSVLLHRNYPDYHLPQPSLLPLSP